jgi:ferritin-like metal-binding protein YciE
VIGNDRVSGGNYMSVATAEELFIDELKDIYSAEKQAVKAFPRLAKAVQSEELKQAMQVHLEQTKGQVERLDRIFEMLDKRSSGKTCEGMKGLVTEAQSQLEEIEKGPVLDCAIIGALQRIEHYEIAAYGTVATLAEAMGQDEVKELLGETLEEEKETDERLTEVAQSVNSEALSEGSGEEDENESGSNGAGSNGSSRRSGSRGSSKASSKPTASRSGSSRSGQKSRR